VSTLLYTIYSTVYSIPYTIYYILSTLYYLLCTIYYLLYSLLYTAYYILSILSTLYCLLYTVYTIYSLPMLSTEFLVLMTLGVHPARNILTLHRVSKETTEVVNTCLEVYSRSTVGSSLSQIKDLLSNCDPLSIAKLSTDSG